MGCLIILANARLEELQFTSQEQRTFFMTEFERIYHLKPNPLPAWNGAVLFRSFPVFPLIFGCLGSHIDSMDAG
jgi:hypothetical protein